MGRVAAGITGADGKPVATLYSGYGRPLIGIDRYMRLLPRRDGVIEKGIYGSTVPGLRMPLGSCLIVHRDYEPKTI